VWLRADEGLRGDATPVQAHAADLVLLDADDLLFELAEANRAPVAAGSGADDDGVRRSSSWAWARCSTAGARKLNREGGRSGGERRAFGVIRFQHEWAACLAYRARLVWSASSALSGLRQRVFGRRRGHGRVADNVTKFDTGTSDQRIIPTLRSPTRDRTAGATSSPRTANHRNTEPRERPGVRHRSCRTVRRPRVRPRERPTAKRPGRDDPVTSQPVERALARRVRPAAPAPTTPCNARLDLRGLQLRR